MNQGDYDKINFLNPSEIIAGHNGQEGFMREQAVQTILIHKRLPPVVLPDVLLPLEHSVIYPVEMLVVDQYENYYYMMTAVMADGNAHTFCERVRTNPEKKNYELQHGWGEGLWNRLRAMGVLSAVDTQKRILCLYPEKEE